MGEEVHGEDYLLIRWGHACYQVRKHRSRNDFTYTGIVPDHNDEDANFIGNPFERASLEIEPLPGREAICRRFAAMTHLRYPGVTVIIVGGEDAE